MIDLEQIRAWRDSGSILRRDVTALADEVERLRAEVERLQTALDMRTDDLYTLRGTEQ